MFSISEKSEYRLCFNTRRLGFFQFLFWIYLICFSYLVYLAVLNVEIIYPKSNLYSFSVLIFISTIVFVVLYKLLMNLRFLAFDITYIIEKMPNRRYIYYYKILGISSSAKVFPDYHYIITQQIRFMGKFGFYIYIFNIKAKEILTWNLFFRLIYGIFHPPYMRCYMCFNSENESKDRALQTNREILSFLDGDASFKPGNRTNLMRINVMIDDVKDFVSKGGDLNARDTILGNTALFYACGTDPELPISKWGEPNFLVLGEMIRLGLDVNACNYKNERVIDYIRKVTSNVSGEPPSLSRLKSFLEGNGYKK